MVVQSVILGNKEGYRVTLNDPEVVALFRIFAETEKMAEQLAKAMEVSDADSGADSGGDEDEAVERTDLAYSKEVIETVINYAQLPFSQRTNNIPKPLKRPWHETVQDHECKLMLKAAAEKTLVPLLELSLELQFRELTALCASFINVEAERIAKNASSIMEGAENIRKYLNVRNEWTDEEMVCLEEEMKLAKRSNVELY